jgi:hypothetical protein
MYTALAKINKLVSNARIMRIETHTKAISTVVCKKHTRHVLTKQMKSARHAANKYYVKTLAKRHTRSDTIRCLSGYLR